MSTMYNIDYSNELIYWNLRHRKLFILDITKALAYNISFNACYYV